MQIRRIWEFLGIRMTRTLQHSKQRKGRPQPANFQADQWTAFFVPLVHIGGYACFVSQSLVVLVIALSIWDGNACFAGHNRGVNNHFGKIHTLEAGDTITLTTVLGTRTYAVSSVEKVSVNDSSGTAPTTDNRVTLYT